jgi:hypothetical protein
MGGSGIIYYTFDGSDPRSSTTGEVAPGAVAYNAPLLLTATTHIKARLFENGSWSALNEAVFNVVEQDRQLRITEIMYHPSGGNQFEFIELKNGGDSAIDLAGSSFEGITFTFPAGASVLSPNEFIVLVSDPASFMEQYPGVPVGGVYSDQLSNTGEAITLRDQAGEVIVSVDYDDPMMLLLK